MENEDITNHSNAGHEGSHSTNDQNVNFEIVLYT